VHHVICSAIANHQLLHLSYIGWSRIVEPHAYGIGAGRHEVIRAWQVHDCVASSEPTGWKLEPIGWKLLRLHAVRSFLPLTDRFLEPRPGYRRGDQDIWLMYCQL
jgi:hypothetical protein